MPTASTGRSGSSSQSFQNQVDKVFHWRRLWLYVGQALLCSAIFLFAFTGCDENNKEKIKFQICANAPNSNDKKAAIERLNNIINDKSNSKKLHKFALMSRMETYSRMDNSLYAQNIIYDATGIIASADFSDFSDNTCQMAFFFRGRAHFFNGDFLLAKNDMEALVKLGSIKRENSEITERAKKILKDMDRLLEAEPKQAK